MATTLGWDEERTAREVADHDARTAAEREWQRLPNDHTADTARQGTPDRGAPCE
jgi:glycerol-3-phosphate dehydrogenase